MASMLAGAPRGDQIKRSDQPGPLPARIGWRVVDCEVEDLSLELRDVGIRGVPLDGSEGKRIASTARSLELLEEAEQAADRPRRDRGAGVPDGGFAGFEIPSA